MQSRFIKSVIVVGCLGLAGCAETMGLSYPDLSNIQKASGEGMSQKESENVIKTLQKDKNTHKDEAIEEIKTGG